MFIKIVGLAVAILMVYVIIDFIKVIKEDNYDEDEEKEF
jgi:hypothetical protein